MQAGPICAAKSDAVIRLGSVPGSEMAFTLVRSVVTKSKVRLTTQGVGVGDGVLVGVGVNVDVGVGVHVGVGVCEGVEVGVGVKIASHQA